jgi:ABC-2 type transport system ATP-binding protein/nitrous oxidase accessory protein
MIHVEGLAKRFGRVTALENLHLHVARGEMLLLLGANGAGKSTLLRCLLGILSYQGAIRVDGLDPLADGREVRRRIGYMPQSGGLYPDLSVRETLRFFSRLREASFEHARELLDEARLDHALDAKVGDLSGGMAQRLGFALALLGNPPVLLLDEPTASLDGASRERVLAKLTELKARGTTILLSTHSRRRPLSMAHRAVTVKEGRIAVFAASDQDTDEIEEGEARAEREPAEKASEQ